MALELDPLVQRFEWNSQDFERGIQRSQQLLRQFSQEMARGEPVQQRVAQFPSMPQGERALRPLQSTLAVICLRRRGRGRWRCHRARSDR
jgi:hypothetical protein